MRFSRRQFFLGASAIALGVAYPAAAWTQGAPPSAFNGGKSQAQCWDMAYSGDFPFINLMLTATNWLYSDNTGAPGPRELDSNGYPIVNGHNGYYCQINIPGLARAGSTIVITWSGNGTLGLSSGRGASFTITSGSLTSTRGTGRVEFKTIEQLAVLLTIVSFTRPNITNVKFFYKDDEAALNAGQFFGTQFLNVLRQGNFGVFRFLDWAAANNTNVTTWDTRKPQSYYSYSAQEYRPSLYAGLATTSSVKKSISFGSGGAVDKKTLHVKWDAPTVTVSIGPNATVTFPSAHGMLVGQAFKFLAPSPSSLPAPIVPASSGDINNQTVYWVTSVPISTTLTFSATKGGANVDTTGGRLVGSPKAFACCKNQAAILSNSNPATVSLADGSPHGLSIGDIFTLSSTNHPSSSYGLPSPLYNGQNLYVLSSGFSTKQFQFALSLGGTPINTAPRNITGATNSGLLTIPNHGLVAVGFIDVAGMTGITGFNGNRYNFSVPDANHIQLINANASATYTGASGTATPSIIGTIEFFQQPTFNLNRTGEAPIVGPWGDPNSDNSDPFPGYIATLVYDADLGSWLANNGNVGGQNGGLLNGVPPEVMVQLCTTLGAHPHFCAPFLAVDPMTDWVPQLANYVKTNGPSWMKPRFEGTNETWNPSLGFYATRYSWRKAPVHWGPAFLFDQQNWYGKIVSTIGQAVNAVYGGTVSTQTNYSVLCGIQTVTAGSNSNDPRITAAQYVSQSAAPQTLAIPSLGLTIPFTQSAASSWATHVVVANYWSSSAVDTPLECQLAYNYCVTNASNPPAQDGNIATYLSYSDGSLTTTYFTGTVASNVLTVSGSNRPIGYQPLAVGQTIFAGSTSFTITSLGSGIGGDGTYNVSSTPNIGPVPMFASGAVGSSPVGPTQTREFSLAYQRYYASNAKTWAASFGVNKMCGYEGGYSPDYAAVHNYPIAEECNSVIVGITATGSPVLITLGTFYGNGDPQTGNPAVIGMPVVLQNIGGISSLNSPSPNWVTVTAGTPGTVQWTNHGLSAGQAVCFVPQTTNRFDSAIPSPLIFGQVYYVSATGLTTNSFAVSATSGGAALTLTGAQILGAGCVPCYVVTALSGSTVTLNVSATGTYTANSGTIQWGGSTSNISIFRRQSKLSSRMQPLALQVYTDFVAQGGEFPSCYFISGSSIWGALDPNIYVGTSPEWAAITAFNH